MFDIVENPSLSFGGLTQHGNHIWPLVLPAASYLNHVRFGSCVNLAA
uniref:Uncharacterized protein n=1 Tax=Utricularia reniformis TaxID=192314 RepID=A0A1Y0AZH7_9LAMI|nr:hypothetical protein AEK19_MT0311 [Utricularia reniformis]ART30586.1 hypothetical protein AEK19_MT0311 [Utricularia reniformis]